MKMKKSHVVKKGTRLKAIWIVALVIALTPASTSAQKSPISIGGSCSKIGSLSGSVTKPLICKRVNGKAKWVLAPGGSCANAGALAGTMKEPWVCQKVSGKLKWVVSVTSNSQSSTTTALLLTSTTKESNPQTSSTIKSIKSPSAGGSSISTVPTTTSTTTTTTTTIPVTCPTSGNVTPEITSASDGAYRTTGISVKMYYYTRSVQGVIRNNSSVPVSVVNLSLSGNLLKDGAIYSSQTVYVVGNVTINPGGAYGWNVSYEALGHRATWSDYSTVGRNETIQSFSFVSTDARCP